jgi:hypothetical protein
MDWSRKLTWAEDADYRPSETNAATEAGKDGLQTGVTTQTACSGNANAANCLDMVGTRRLELLTSTVSICPY